jgi:hypothetical protein
VPDGVRVFGYWDSRPEPQIIVNFGNTPLTGASVEVYREGSPLGGRPKTNPILVLTSDANGHVVLPSLDSGKYYILGRSKPDREDYLYLEISPSGRKWDDLVLNLDPARGSAEWAIDSLGTIDHATQVSTFHGVVEDFGKPLPDADIDVFARKLGIDQQPIHLRSDSSGEFSANLPEGQYAVHIEKNMSESLFWIDISHKGYEHRIAGQAVQDSDGVICILPLRSDLLNTPC